MNPVLLSCSLVHSAHDVFVKDPPESAAFPVTLQCFWCVQTAGPQRAWRIRVRLVGPDSVRGLGSLTRVDPNRPAPDGTQRLHWTAWVEEDQDQVLDQGSDPSSAFILESGRKQQKVRDVCEVRQVLLSDAPRGEVRTLRTKHETVERKTQNFFWEFCWSVLVSERVSWWSPGSLRWSL